MFKEKLAELLKDPLFLINGLCVLLSGVCLVYLFLYFGGFI